MFNSSLTIAIPLYNESETIDYMKERLLKAIEKINLHNLNILFVDDGSTDNTYDLLTEKFSDFKNVEIIKSRTDTVHKSKRIMCSEFI